MGISGGSEVVREKAAEINAQSLPIFLSLSPLPSRRISIGKAIDWRVAKLSSRATVFTQAFHENLTVFTLLGLAFGNEGLEGVILTSYNLNVNRYTINCVRYAAPGVKLSAL